MTASGPADYMESITRNSITMSSRAPSHSVDSYQSSEYSSQAREHLKAELMVNHLRQKQVEKRWADISDLTEQGVILRRDKDTYVCKPMALANCSDGLFHYIRHLKTRVALTVQTEVLTKYLEQTQLSYVPYHDGLRIQMLYDISELPNCKINQRAAFIQHPPMLIVWHDDPEMILQRAEDIQDHLITFIWNSRGNFLSNGTSTPSEYQGSTYGFAGEGEKSRIDVSESVVDKPRKFMLYQAILTAFTSALIIACLSLGVSKIAYQTVIDGDYRRYGLLVFVPAQIWIGWFFFHSLVNSFAQIFGPVNQVDLNSTGYSSVPPKRLTSNSLPHVTIQCPIYKEGLWSVIDPTLTSVRTAISTYEMQGGSANIFVNDDGMQAISPEDAEARRQYYEDHDIGWVARPKHNPNPKDEKEEPFIRPGKFKKASNMNYAMGVSAEVEDRMRAYERPDCWTQNHEDTFYRTTLAKVLKEHNGRTWAAGNIRFGDYIVIIDSDTRLPDDAFLDLVSEMEASPDVAIIQVASGVMNVTTSYFEKGITYFTNLVYTAIQYAVANGDIACFVGHNAIIRWTALQDIRFDDKGIEKYWSETTVSEDFDLALRLQATGYEIRFCTYFNGSWKEGVSLTVYDELARWEKYAYGCSELVFQPFIYWITRGPFTPLFRKFITSRIPIMAKLTIMSYIGTYYALASTWILTFANYFLMGWLNSYVDHYYLNSFNILFSVVMVFQALGSVSLAVLRYRISDRSLLGSFLENLSWSPLLSIFLGGVSIHIFQALTCHMFSVDIGWGATSKEETKTTFFGEIPTIFRKFKFSFCYCIVVTGAMITMAGIGPLGALVPPLWRIDAFVAVFPLSVSIVFHFMMPLVLNPSLMQFTF